MPCTLYYVCATSDPPDDIRGLGEILLIVNLLNAGGFYAAPATAPIHPSICFSQCMLHVLAARNVRDYLVDMISDLCSFVKLSFGSRFG